MEATCSSTAASLHCSSSISAISESNIEEGAFVYSPSSDASEAETKTKEGRRFNNYWRSIFSGDLCCKLWFTTPRAFSRKLLSRLTDLLRSAVGEQRANLNPHIPTDVLRSLAGHTREKVCIANHKAFWPYPPTLLHLFSDLEVYAGAQCMGDMVVQNSSQLHWGVNLAGGVKAESSNCAGRDFWRFCSECSDGLFCGVETDLLRHVFHTARKEYWGSRKVKNWRRKKSVCWGYHGCGCIRPRVLGLEETGTMKTGGYQTTAGAGNKRKQDNLDGVPAACSDMVEGRSQKDIVGMRTQDRGWGRTFDWDLLFKSLKVKLCWEEWEKLKWLRWEDQTKDTNKQTHKQNKLAKNTNTCSSSNGNTNSSSNNNNNSSSRQQPPSLFSLLEEDVSEVQGEGERNMDSEGEEQRRNEEDRNNAHANDRQGIEQENNETEKARQTSNQQDERRPWEADGLRSCIRFVTSVSPQQLLQMPACTQVDISSPPPKKNQHSLTTAKAEGETNDGVPAATDEQKDKRKARTCTSVPAGEGGSSASTPASASAAAAAAAAAATAAAATAATAGGGDGGGGVCNDREHIATVEFQRMWPVFVRIGEESRLPVNGDEEGVVLFLGCLLEVFHMRVNTQKEFSLCLRGIAEAAKADNNSSQVMQPQDLHTHAENKKNDNGGSSNNSSNSSNIYSSSQLADKAAPTASPSLLPPAQSARGREAENNTSDAPNNTMQTSARLHSDGDDNNDAEKQEEEAYEDSRVLPKILFEPAPKRAQLVFSASSSLGAAETNLRRTSGGLEAECLTKEREAEGECVDNDSKAKASHSPTAAPVYLAPEDSSYVDGGQLTRRKPAGNAKEKESSGQGAAEAVLQLQGRDGFQEMKGESRVDKSKANSPCLKVERSSASNTAGGESGYRLLHVSVPSYDRKGVQNTASIQMPQTMQTNTTSPCSTSLGGKAFANAREAQSGNNLQGWGYGVQAWTGQESGPQHTYVACRRGRDVHNNGRWPLFDPYARPGLSCRPIYPPPYPPPPPLPRHMQDSSPRSCQPPPPPPPPTIPHHVPHAPPNSIHIGVLGDNSRSHWNGISGPNTTYAAPAPPWRQQCPAVGPLTRACGERQDLGWGSAELINQSTRPVPFPAVGVGCPRPQPDMDASVAGRGSGYPQHHQDFAGERVKSAECGGVRFQDRLSRPCHEAKDADKTGLSPSCSWNVTSRDGSGSILEPSEAPAHTDGNHGFSITSQKPLRTPVDHCRPVSGPSEATASQVEQDANQSNRNMPHIPETVGAVTAHKILPRTHADLQAEYKLYLKRRLEAVIRGVWSWRSESVSDFSQYHDEPFSASVARNAIRDGFTPYVLMHYASTTGAEERLKPLDMSVGGRRNIPFSGFSQELIDSLCSGIGHGMMYYSVVPGSVFPIHCEQGGLGAFNIVIGALMSYTESLCL